MLCKKSIVYINIIKWNDSPSPNVEFYRIYRNGNLIKEVKASSPHVFRKCNTKNRNDCYSVTAVGAQGQESAPITVCIKRLKK